LSDELVIVFNEAVVICFEELSQLAGKRGKLQEISLTQLISPPLLLTLKRPKKK
jgi:hypothetical protein